MKTNTTKLRRALETFAKTGKITLTATALMALALSAPANAERIVVTSGNYTNNGTLEISGNTVSEEDGGGIYFAGSNFHNNSKGSITISGNSAVNGGGFYGEWQNSGTITLSGNSAVNGGGVYGKDSSDVLTTKEGGSLFIYDNAASNYGGGAYVGYTFTISDGCTGYIGGNTADNGGGLYIGINSGTGIIAFAKSLGTLYVGLDENGNAKGNTATNNGGGIYNTKTFSNYHTYSTGTVYGNVVIANNTAIGGAGVFNTGTFEFISNDGETLLVEGNSASGWGAGITSNGRNVDGKAVLTLKGAEVNDEKTIQINNNTAWGAGGLNIMDTDANVSDVSFSGNKVNTYGGALWAGYGANVTLENVTMDGGITENTGSNLRNAHAGGGIWIANGKNWTDPTSVTVDNVTIENMIAYGNENEPGLGGGIGMEKNTTLNVVGDLAITGTNTNEKFSNKTVLGAGIYAAGTVNVKEGATLKLDNNQTSMQGGGLYITSDAEHKVMWPADSTDIAYYSKGEVTIENGAVVNISNNKAADGAGIYIEAGEDGKVGGTFTNAGTLNVIGNTATGNGGGVYNAGEFTNVRLHNTTPPNTYYGNVTIANNKADGGAGVFNTGTFEFISKDGATLLVEGNSTLGRGAGFTNAGGTLTLTGAENNDGSKTIQFNYNTASNSQDGSKGGCGGVYVNGGTANISNVSFMGNAANTYGGAIWANAGANVTLTDVIMDGGILNKNTHPNWTLSYYRNAWSGGGLAMSACAVAAQSCTVTVDGLEIQNMTVFGNESMPGMGGGVAVLDGNTLNIKGKGLLVENTNVNLKNPTLYGGGIVIGGSVVNIEKDSQMVLNNNHASYGGGLYMWDGYGGSYTGYYTLDTKLEIGENAVLKVTNNTATISGGGLNLDNDVIVNHGEIIVTGNTAPYGGGIYAGADLTLGGKGTFSGNIASTEGDDIYAEKNVTFSEDAKYTFDGGIVSKGTMTLQNGAEVALKSGSESNVNALVNDGTMKFELDPGESEFGTITTESYSGSGKVAVGINGFTTLPADKQTQTIVSGADASGNVEANKDLLTVKGENGNTTVTVKETGKIGDGYGNVAAAGTPGVEIFQKDDKGNYVKGEDGNYVLAGGGEKVHDFSFIVDSANSEINLDDFANWLGDETGLETVVGTGYVSVRLETPFEIMASDRFVWDFSDYKNGIANLQFASVNMMDSTVPEPTTWALLVLGGLGIFGIARKNRKAKK